MIFIVNLYTNYFASLCSTLIILYRLFYLLLFVVNIEINVSRIQVNSGNLLCKIHWPLCYIAEGKKKVLFHNIIIFIRQDALAG